MRDCSGGVCVSVRSVRIGVNAGNNVRIMSFIGKLISA